MLDEVRIQRRLVHLSGTAVPAAYLLDVISWQTVRYLLAAGAAAVVVLEFIRLYVGLDWVVYDRLTRDYEQTNPAGYALAVVGAALVGWTFEPQVAVTAILLLTVADPISGVLSTAEDPDTAKSLGVMGVTFLVCLAITGSLLPLTAAIPTAAVAVAADALKPRVYGFVIDDNFSIPVSAALVASITLAYVPPVL
ncbi:dolichol kinase [Halobacteriales archaeon Cl-PHB]